MKKWRKMSEEIMKEKRKWRKKIDQCVNNESDESDWKMIIYSVIFCVKSIHRRRNTVMKEKKKKNIQYSKWLEMSAKRKWKQYWLNLVVKYYSIEMKEKWL